MSDETSGAGGWTVSEDGGARGAVTPSAGVLASGGAATVSARVHLRPTPQIVPADLAEVLVAVRDAAGTLTDWRLDPARLLDRPQASVAQTRDRFAAWRSAYVTEKALGDLATVRAFVAWSESRTEVGALRALTSPEVRIDPATATRVAAQVEAVARLVRASDDVGIGVAAPTRPGLLRGFVTGDQPLVVLAAGTTQLSVTRAGLELTETAASASFPAAVLAPAPDRAWTVPVVGWELDAAGVRVLTDAGEVALGDSAAAKLLSYTAPGATLVRVYPVPLTSVFAHLLVELPPLALAAARAARPLIVGH